jgi:ribosome-associated translation inhibitor RaiA
MKTNIIAIGIRASESLKEYITERLSAVMTRAQNSVHDITIRLTDLNNTGSDIDKRCLIHVKLPGMSPIVVSGLAADITSAIDIAAQRVSKAVGRVISRTKSTPHETMPLYIKRSFLAT